MTGPARRPAKPLHITVPHQSRRTDSLSRAVRDRYAISTPLHCSISLIAST